MKLRVKKKRSLSQSHGESSRSMTTQGSTARKSRRSATRSPQLPLKAGEIEDLLNKKLGMKFANAQARTSVNLKPYLHHYKLVDPNITYKDQADVEHAVVKSVIPVRKLKLQSRNDS